MKWTNKGHQFDALGEHLKNKELIIYGAGARGTAFLKEMRRMGLDGKIKGFVDRNASKICECEGLPVYDISEVLPQKKENYTIVVSIGNPKERQALSDRLVRAGYVGGWDFFFSDEFTLLYNNIALPVYALYEADKLVLSSGCFIPSTVCNLNCRNCLNFTPYIREFETRTIESLKADVDLLFHTIDYFGRFQISGGEPMLYPKLNELIAYIGEHYRGQIGCFETVMNGTIVPDDDICRSAKKYELTMILDNYVNEIPPQMNQRSEIIAQFERFELLWLDNTVEDWFDLDIDGTDNTDMTEEQLQEWFDICNMPWHNYENGRFYTCNFARFAEKAGIHSEPETSSYSIKEFTPQKKKELLEFSLHYNEKGYVELCKHCSGWGECNPKRVSVAVQSLRGER